MKKKKRKSIASDPVPDGSPGEIKTINGVQCSWVYVGQWPNDWRWVSCDDIELAWIMHHYIQLNTKYIIADLLEN